MLKVPTKLTIEIEPGKGKAIICSGEDVLVVTDASLAGKTVEPWWWIELREKCTGSQLLDSGENEQFEEFVNCLRLMSNKSKDLFGELSHLLSEMQNLHSSEIE